MEALEPQHLKSVLIHNKRTLAYGRALYVIGSHANMGAWKISKAIKMNWEPGNNWTIAVKLPTNSKFEYKFFESCYNGVSEAFLNWDDGPNRILNIDANKPNEMIKVMSFNIRYDNPRDYPSNGWLQRRDSVVETIKEYDCDIVSFQESMSHMTDFILSELGDKYEIVFRGREWNGQGESTAFFYKKDRFALIDYSFFWLSDTRYQPGSVYEGSMFPRIVTWGYLREMNTEKNIIFVNNHYEHMPLQEKIRLNSTVIIKEELIKILKANDLNEKNTAIIITGDFNAGKSEPFYKYMLSEIIPLKDSSYLLDPKEKTGTFHNFTGTAGSNQIDLIFSGYSIEAKSYSIIRKKRKDGLYPSDHFPIVAEFILN